MHCGRNQFLEGFGQLPASAINQHCAHSSRCPFDRQVSVHWKQLCAPTRVTKKCGAALTKRGWDPVDKCFFLLLPLADGPVTTFYKVPQNVL